MPASISSSFEKSIVGIFNKNTFLKQNCFKN